MAKGIQTSSAIKGKVPVTFGWELMARINEVAERDEVSFAEAVRRICRKHFEQEEEKTPA